MLQQTRSEARAAHARINRLRAANAPGLLIHRTTRGIVLQPVKEKRTQPAEAIPVWG
jgi:ribosomal protein L18